MEQIEGQLSMFDDPDRVEKMDRLHRMYQEALDVRGPHIGWTESRKEIQDIVEKANGNMDILVESLKEYYGTGGFSIKGGMFNYDGASVWIQAWKPWETMIIPWKKFAKDINRLCMAGLW